jgi:hypothetical protein
VLWWWKTLKTWVALSAVSQPSPDESVNFDAPPSGKLSVSE